MLKALVVLLAVASLTSAFPNHWRDSTYMKEIRLQQKTDEECEKQLPLTPKKVCHSVTATDAHGKTKYVHVCPLYDRGQYNKICFVGSAVTRCCTKPKEEFERRGLRKISETRMSVLEKNVNATIYKNEEDVPCVLFEPRGDIRSCCEGEDRPLQCPLTETEPPPTTTEPPTEPPTLPPCKSKGDLYFILDTTATLYHELFCKLTYVIQQIVIAVKAAGVQTRIGGVTFEYVSSSGIDDVYEIFEVKDKCQDVVKNKLPRLISQYYLAYDKNAQANTPWVRVKSTRITESLTEVKGLIEKQSADRRVAVVTLTDGDIDDIYESTTEVNDLSGLEGIVLIAGGINIRENSEAADKLRLLTGGKNTNVVIVESEKVKEFAKGIVNKMKDNNVLCETEADTINKALDDKFDKDITNYCTTDCVFNENYSTCEHLPECGQSRAILSGDTSMLSASEELEKEILKEEIYAAVDKVIESDFGKQLQHIRMKAHNTFSGQMNE